MIIKAKDPEAMTRNMEVDYRYDGESHGWGVYYPETKVTVFYSQDDWEEVGDE